MTEAAVPPSRPGPGAVFASLLRHPVEWACGLLMTAIAGIVFLQVITRYLLTYPLDWPEELARILFVWVTLLGAVLALRRGGHFSISLATRLLPPGLERGASVCLRLLLFGFLLLVAYLGADATLRVRPQLSTGLEISMSYGYAAVPVSAALMALEMARTLWRDLMGGAR